MAQQPIELILMKQLASYLATPIFLLDRAGALVYFNIPAEEMLGLRFDETGELALDEWGAALHATTADGTPVPVRDLPMVDVVADRRPAQGSFWTRGLDGVTRHIATAVFPLIGQTVRDLGTVALCWEDDGR